MRKTALLFLSLCGFSTSGAADIKLPDLGDPAMTTLSQAQENALGLLLWGEVNELNMVEPDSAISEYLQRIGTRLNLASENDPAQYTFFALRGSHINAFALPGGYVGVQAGLISATRSEDELAAVIAHEIAHVRGKHISRMLHYNHQVNTTSMLGMLAGIAAAIANPMVGTSIITTAMAGSRQSMINFTRQHETEADSVGMQLLWRAGYNPSAMADFFGTLARQNGGPSNPAVEYLRTHPLSEDRMHKAQSRADQYNSPIPFKKPLAYSIIQTRLQVNAFTAPRLSIAHFENVLAANPTSPIALYGLAFSYLQNHQPDKTLLVLSGKLPELNTSSEFHILYAQALWERQQRTSALEMLENIRQIHPDDLQASLILAGYLLEEDSAQVVPFLNRLALRFPKSPDILFMLSRAFAQKERFFDAHLAQADYQLQKGQISLALLQLEQAQRWTEEKASRVDELKEKQSKIYRQLNLQKDLSRL